MHSRKLDMDGKQVTLDFGHEGTLYHASFVMYDKQTDSKWNHSTGLAMFGRLVGQQLTILPSRVLQWRTWRAMHPQTKVIAREGRWGFMGTYVGDRRPSDLGLSVGQGPKATLYPFDVLLRSGVVNDVVTPFPVVVVIDPATAEALAFSRRVASQTLTFAPLKTPKNASPLMRDQETGTRWQLKSGRAVEGPLKGSELLSLISVPWLIERWRQIYPEGTIYPGPKK